MTAAPRKGRKVSFEAAATAPEADPWSQISTLRFMIDPPYGGELLVDFTSLRPRGLALAFARGLFMLVAPRGPILVRSSIKTYVTQLPSFFAYLAGTGDRINGPADLRTDHIDGFERWLAAQGKSRTHAPTYVAKVVSVLRRIAADGPELVDPGLRERLRYVSSHPHVRPRPRDAYSPYVARQLRDAARADLVAIEARLRSGPRFDEVPETEGAYREAHAAIDARGVLHYRDPAYQSLYKLRWIRELSGARFNLSLHAAHYLTAHDVVPLLVLLSLETGLELECCKSLTIDCLRNASGGTVDVAYTKLRAHGAEHKTIRVRDGGSSTPGGLIRRIIALSAKARVHNSSDNLWVYYQTNEITAGIRQPRMTIDAWTQRHGIVDDAGRPLFLRLSQLRKTHKALWYLKTEGHMARFAVGHTAEIAARHYADIPALRPLHEQAVADALEEALTGPRILPPSDEERLRRELASPAPDVEGVSRALLDGEQDVWLANCGNFYSSPFASAGTACPTPFWGCLDCRNAVITARKLPAILAFHGMTQGIDVTKLTLMLNELRLPTIKQLWPTFAERSDKEGWPAARFLSAITEHEIAERGRRRMERHLAEAKLLPGKTLDTFDFDAVPMISKAQVMAICAGDSWLENGANLILFGPPGGGKSHLSSGIGLALIEKGWRVLFVRTSDLVQKLQVARRELALENAINRLDRFDLLILDDLAYVAKDQAETSVLFELISARYERRSLMITANQPFGEWNRVFPDPAMTLAAVDRLVHHATIFEMNVESYRRRTAIERKQQGAGRPAKVATAKNTDVSLPDNQPET